VGVPPRTERQRDTQMSVTTIHFASSTTHAKCNNASGLDIWRLVIILYFKNVNQFATTLEIKFVNYKKRNNNMSLCHSAS